MSETTTLYVSNGRTVIVDGASAGPGDHVTLPRREAARLMSLGFVQKERPTSSGPACTENPAGIGPHGGEIQGPRF